MRQGGVLLLGNAETVGSLDKRFDVISKPERLYRHIGHNRTGEFGFPMSDGVRVPTRPGQGQAPSRQAVLADLCRRLVMDAYAPAAVLINGKNECLFPLGPVDRYLHVALGHPTHDLLAIARQGVRTALRAAVQQAHRDNVRADSPPAAASVTTVRRSQSTLTILFRFKRRRKAAFGLR